MIPVYTGARGGGPRSSIGDFCEHEGHVSQIIGRRFRCGWGEGIVSDHRFTISACRGGRAVPDYRSVISLSMRGGCHGLTISACRGGRGGVLPWPRKGP